jgi:hypothetical protein
MKTSYKKKSGMPAIRIPVAPPGKVMASPRDYDRKHARKEIEKLLVESE